MDLKVKVKSLQHPQRITHVNHKTSMHQGGVPNGTANGNGVANGVSMSTAWRQETLQNPSSTAPLPREVDPTLYEELKLGTWYFYYIIIIIIIIPVGHPLEDIGLRDVASIDILKKAGPNCGTISLLKMCKRTSIFFL